MGRRFGILGILALVVVFALVLWLAARGWQRVAPNLLSPPDRSSQIESTGTAPPVPSGTTRRGDLPDLDEMKRGTDEHSRRVQEALAATD